MIQLEAGQFVPADARVLESVDLRTVEATLTGESLPAAKAADPLPADTTLPERRNMLYQGTAAADGTARALVVAIKGTSPVVAHGAPGMMVWGALFLAEANGNQSKADGRIRDVVAFIESIQVK